MNIAQSPRCAQNTTPSPSAYCTMFTMNCRRPSAVTGHSACGLSRECDAPYPVPATRKFL